MALAADVTRGVLNVQRVDAALIGVSIGLSFYVAL